MKKYRCIRDCVVNIGGRRVWRTDMVLEVEDNVDVPSHFIPEETERVVPVKINDMDTLSGIQKKQKDLSRPKTGFAANLDKIEPEKTTKKKR